MNDKRIRIYMCDTYIEQKWMFHKCRSTIENRDKDKSNAQWNGFGT